MKQIAIIKDVKYGYMEETGRVMLVFTVYISESICAGVHLDVEEAAKMIKEYKVSDTSKLEGKPCFVEVSGQTIRYLEPMILR